MVHAGKPIRPQNASTAGLIGFTAGFMYAYQVIRGESSRLLLFGVEQRRPAFALSVFGLDKHFIAVVLPATPAPSPLSQAYLPSLASCSFAAPPFRTRTHGSWDTRSKIAVRCPLDARLRTSPGAERKAKGQGQDCNMARVCICFVLSYYTNELAVQFLVPPPSISGGSGSIYEAPYSPPTRAPSRA